MYIDTSYDCKGEGGGGHHRRGGEIRLALEEPAVKLPAEYDGCNCTPGTPTFDGAEGVYPIEVVRDSMEETIYMYSDDFGMTWSFG